MAEITDAEHVLLKEFRSKISDVVRPEHDDYHLVKWLRARRHDIQKSEDMYRKSMIWRQEERIDHILEEFKIPEVMAKYYPGGMSGRDREGRILWIDPLGKLDVRGLMCSVKKADILRTIVYRLEVAYREFEKASLEEGKRIDQCTTILDLEGFGSKHLWKSAAYLYSDLIKVMEANYPETLRKTFIINTPKVFMMAYSFLKGFLPEDTTKKFEILGATDWADKVFKEIDPSQLPEHYHGTRRDPDGDPKCSSTICYGGPVPDRYYKNKEVFFPPDVTPKTADIGRGSKVKLEYEITQAPCGMRYIFSTQGGALYFGVFRKTSSEVKDVKDMEVVEGIQKIDSHIVPDDGTIICDKPGTYVLLFENTSSILSKRKLTYHVDILNEEDTMKSTSSSEMRESLNTLNITSGSNSDPSTSNSSPTAQAAMTSSGQRSSQSSSKPASRDNSSSSSASPNCSQTIRCDF